MKFSEIAELLRKRGYVEREPKDHYRIFYEFGAMDFLYADVAKKYEMEYRDGEVNEVVMIEYRFGETEFKYIKTVNCNIESANIPINYIQELNALFDRGVKIYYNLLVNC